MRTENLCITLLSVIGGVLIGSGLGIYLGYPPFTLITELGISGPVQLKLGSVMAMVAGMAHIALGGSLIP